MMARSAPPTTVDEPNSGERVRLDSEGGVISALPAS
jgi:hypothetical protein